MNATHYLAWKAQQRAKMSAFGDTEQFGTPSVPASKTPAPRDASVPHSIAVPGMQPHAPVLPTTMGGLIPLDVRPAPSGKPSAPRDIQGGPGTPGYEQRVAAFARENPDLVQLADPTKLNPRPRANAQGAVEHPGTAQGRQVVLDAERGKAADPFDASRLIHASRLS
jgi:hypothetical protein